ncbi:MAG: hypothetical protein EXR93_09185 [Gemmatimonadetes bacterium]|nr:hypothetical protein [Gemmatimonadota bacterium]
MSPTSRSVASTLAGLMLGGFGTLAAQAVADVQIAPPSVTVAVGGRSSVFATAYAANGNVVPIERLRWTMSNPQVVQIHVDSTSQDIAVLVGVSAGSAIVEAWAGPKRGTATVEVKVGGAGPVAPPPLANAGGAALIKVNPGALYMLPGEAVRPTVEFLREDGTAATPMAVTWKSLLPTVASVDPSGQVVAISPGQGLIEVQGTSGIVSRVPVQVSNAGLAVIRRAQGGMMSPGMMDTLMVVIPDQSNRRIPVTSVQWRSTDESIARVTPFGVVSAVSGGRAEIVISGYLQEIRAPIVVHKAIEFLSLSPPARDTVRVSLGGTARFIAQPQASDGSAIPEARVQWTLLDSMVIGFDPNTGIATPKRLGLTRLRVSAPGWGDTAWIVSVVAGGIGLSTHRVGIAPGEHARVGASFVDDNGRPFGPANGLRWGTSAPTVATVDNDGSVMATGLGQALITATTTWGKTDTVRVFVQNELLVVSTREGGNADLYTTSRAAPGAFTRLTAQPASDVSGSFSPDGSSIAFISTRDQNQEIYVMDADGSNARRLTSTAGGEDSPRWTPDGKQLVYASNATGSYQVWIMNAEGSEAKRLTEGPAFNSQPTVSPDGKSIAFTSTRDGNYEVYLMDLGGANQRNVTRSPAVEMMPVWFPDGKLGFVQEQKQGPARNAPVLRVAVRAEAAGGPVTNLTPTDMNVSDFSVSREGDMIAVIASVQVRGRVPSSKLILLPTAPGGIRIEVPTANPQEQIFSPSFRR